MAETNGKECPEKGWKIRNLSQAIVDVIDALDNATLIIFAILVIDVLIILKFGMEPMKELLQLSIGGLLAGWQQGSKKEGGK